MYFAPVVMAIVLAILALVSILLVNTAETQEEGPCPRPYIKVEEGPCPRPYIKVIYLRAGTPGDEVKIRGRRFGTEEGEVHFNPKVEAEVVNWSMYRIHVIVPEAATTGPVTVSIPCGAVSNEQHFTVSK
jgi:hypothetical protein